MLHVPCTIVTYFKHECKRFESLDQNKDLPSLNENASFVLNSHTNVVTQTELRFI